MSVREQVLPARLDLGTKSMRQAEESDLWGTRASAARMLRPGGRRGSPVVEGMPLPGHCPVVEGMPCLRVPDPVPPATWKPHHSVL